MSVPSIRPELVLIPNSATPADRSIEKRRLRKHSVLNVIRKHGPLSRADITKVSGYNLPSVSSLVDELVENGLVIEEEAKAVPRGRRPIPVYLNENAAAVMGIDIGKRSTIALMVNLAGKVISRFERKTPQLKTTKAHAEWAVKVTEKLLEDCPGIAIPLSGIGVAIPGLINESAKHSNEINEGAPAIREALTEKYGVPTIVENDARMMALGSLWFGIGNEYSSFAVVNIGHGIGLGMIIDGKVFTGKQGFACELGYIPLGQNGVPGYLGHPQCLENTASGAGLMRLAEERGLKIQDVSELADLARGGNQKALDCFKIFTEHLGRALATISNLFDPQAIILAGRVCRASDLFFEQAKEETRKHALGPIFDSTPILLSVLGVDLGPLGAAAAVLHQIFHSTHVQVDEVI